MENPSLPSPSNIVAAAMCKANLTTLSPDSPKVSSIPIAGESSPKRSHTPMVGSPAQHARSPPAKLSCTKSMEINQVAATPVRPFIRQHSQDSDSHSQSMEANQTLPSSPFREDKTVVMRTDGKDPHLVTVTPPTPFPTATISGDTKMQRLQVYSSSSDKQLMSVLPGGMQLITKPEGGEVDMRPKPKDDMTYPITCGTNRAELVWKKFICPGINAKCVKCGDNWYTPKEFVNYAGKSTLKDWKRAIRINGTMLRKKIENGELNYYDHENNCSNQCRSNKSASFDNSTEKSYNSFESEPSLDHAPMLSNEDSAFLTARRHALANSHSKSLESTNGNSLERSSSEDSGLSGSPHLEGVLMREAPVTVEKIQDLLAFWNGIIRMEAFDEIVRDVLTHITSLHTRTKQNGGISMEDVVAMTNLVNSLEMIPNIASKISMHKHKVEKETEESSQAIQELERKLAEQKKYEQDLKRKSQHLDSVISLTPTEKRQKRAIMRIGRQKAVESRIPPGSSSSALPSDLRGNPHLATSGRLPQQRELWPQTIQVDGLARAASSQMARMNVSGSSSQTAAMSPGIPQFPIFPTSAIHHSSPEGFVPSPIQQAFVSAQSPMSRDTQSPKK